MRLAAICLALAAAGTAQALEVIAGTGGARCCKRDSWLALLSAVRFARERLGVDLEGRGPVCEFSARNRECLGDGCPFHCAEGAAGGP